MKTNFKKDGDTVIVNVNGKIDYENQAKFKENLQKMSASNAKTDSVPKRIIFNLEGLEFVGSCGISSFVQTLDEFNQSAPVKPKYCNVKNEFKRMIRAISDGTPDSFEIFENEARAKSSYDH